MSDRYLKIEMQMQYANKTHPIPIIWTGAQLLFNKLVDRIGRVKTKFKCEK